MTTEHTPPPPTGEPTPPPTGLPGAGEDFSHLPPPPDVTAPTSTVEGWLPPPSLGEDDATQHTETDTHEVVPGNVPEIAKIALASMDLLEPRAPYDPAKAFVKKHLAPTMGTVRQEFRGPKNIEDRERQDQLRNPEARDDAATGYFEAGTSLNYNLIIDKINKEESHIRSYTDLYHIVGPDGDNLLFDEQALKQYLRNSQYDRRERNAIRRAGKVVRHSQHVAHDLRHRLETIAAPAKAAREAEEERRKAAREAAE